MKKSEFEDLAAKTLMQLKNDIKNNNGPFGCWAIEKVFHKRNYNKIIPDQRGEVTKAYGIDFLYHQTFLTDDDCNNDEDGERILGLFLFFELVRIEKIYINWTIKKINKRLNNEK